MKPENSSPRPEPGLDEALDAARASQPDVPASLPTTVMARVEAADRSLTAWDRSRRASASRRITNFLTRSRVDSTKPNQWRPTAAGGGTIVAKKILWGVTGIAAAAIIAFAVFGYPPAIPGTEGTVGAAKRYQGSQMTSDDVGVGTDVIQDFMQSETFDYLLKNPDTRSALHAAVTHEALANVLSDAEAIKTLASPEAVRLFSQAELADALADPELRVLFARADVQAMLASAELRASLAANAKVALASPEARVLAQADALKALAAPKALALFANPAFAQALAEPNLRMMFAQDAMVKALADPGLVRLFARSEFAAALTDANFRAVFAQPALAQALATPALAQSVAARLQ